MQVGKWLEIRGIEVGKPSFRAAAGQHVEVSKDAASRAPLERTYTSGGCGESHAVWRLGMACEGRGALSARASSCRQAGSAVEGRWLRRDAGPPLWD